MVIFSRSIRRFFIAIIFLVIFSLIGFGLKKVLTPVSTCTDGIQNGQEEGADCGLVACGKECEPELAPLRVVSTALIQAGERDYDFIVEVANPNKEFGASEVAYELILFNGDNTILSKREGFFYILSNQTKFVILPFLTAERNVSKRDFKIKSVKWQEINLLEDINFIIRGENYSVLDGGASSVLEAGGLNNSDFDFETVDIDIVLRDSRGEILSVNKSEIRTFLAHTERHFKANWPFTLGGQVVKVEIFPSTNLFKNSNFLKRYGSEVEKFQQY